MDATVSTEEVCDALNMINDSGISEVEPRPADESQEAALKKKLQNFLHELQRVGTLQGFKHFKCYVRGREELVLSVNNTLPGGNLSLSGNLSIPSSRKQSLCKTDSFSSSHLPYDKRSLILSHNTQVGLSGLAEKGVGLPPASPSEEENTLDEDITLFLIAGYARYSCPYVWVRSNHERLLKLSGDADSDKDSPLRLKSTARWKDTDVQVTDIIAEVVRLCTYPAPRNPFEVDLDYFRSLSQPDQLLASAAMVAFLQKIIVHTDDSRPYMVKVSEDLQHMSKFHFTSLRDTVNSTSIPVLQQQRQQQKQHHQQRQPQRRPSGPGSAHYPKVLTPTAAPPIQAPMSVYPSSPVNASGIVYGQGSRGAFPGGFNRTPAPTMF